MNCSLTDLIFINTKILDKSRHWSLLICLESIVISRHKTGLNHGTKASNELLIFKWCILSRDVARTFKGESPADTNYYDRFDAPIALNNREV